MDIVLIALIVLMASLMQFAFIIFIVIPIMRLIFEIATPPRSLMLKYVAIISLVVNMSIFILGQWDPIAGYLSAMIIMIYGMMRIFELNIVELIGFLIISAAFSATLEWILSLLL